ncbi:MAG: VOC family protein [Candidatus Binataceae bacterium]|nr:VOC family protein [Candidatus Binataceae bacterium]
MSIRLRQICLVAEKLAPVIADFKAVLGLEVCFKDPEVAVFGLENSLMPVGDNFIEVVAPTKDNTAAGRYLKRRKGDGGYMVICQCDSHATQLARKARAATLSVRLVLDHETPAFHAMQLHPADTGGAFFEIDWDAKGEPTGTWSPAGGAKWTAARRLEVVTAYRAVELQAADPRALAERWSTIAEIALRKDAQGRLAMPLENAEVRFVGLSDDRGEGLAGIDIAVADRDRLVAAATARGCRVGRNEHGQVDQVELCGTRFYLV